MKILVTGGAGFIGSNFLEYMLEKYPKYEYVCLDNLSVEDSKSNLTIFDNYKNIKFIKGDITDEKFIDELFNIELFDWVINFAAEISVDYSIENPNVFIKTNVLGVAILMGACLKYKVKKFHQISTDEVYGDLALDSEYYFKEDDVLKPSNPYAASKAAADNLVLSYHRTYDLNVTISRCTNNYGPRQSARALIPKTINLAINSQPIPIYGTGKNERDWLYVLDHIKAVDLIIHKGKNGNIYNISSNERKNNVETVLQIISLLKKNESLITFVNDRPGHDLMYSLDSSKIKKDLGWKKEVDFNEGINKTINWFIK